MHLLFSLLIAGVSAALIFNLWYPQPFAKLSGGTRLFILMLAVDVICGPVLTLIVFNPAKKRRELWFDLSLILTIQLLALGYGAMSMMLARPVFIAFEGDRFRLVAEVDIDIEKLREAPSELQALSLKGPRPLGVRLATGSDPDFRESITLSLEGLPPSFRPSRWTAFDYQRQIVISAAMPLSNLYAAHPAAAALLSAKVEETGIPLANLGYLPLAAGPVSDWSVLVDMQSGDIAGYIHLDAWP